MSNFFNKKITLKLKGNIETYSMRTWVLSFLALAAIMGFITIAAFFPRYLMNAKQLMFVAGPIFIILSLLITWSKKKDNS